MNARFIRFANRPKPTRHWQPPEGTRTKLLDRVKQDNAFFRINMNKLSIFLILLSVTAFGQKTTITDTIRAGDGSLANGVIYITPSQQFTTSGGVVVAPIVTEISVRNGVFRVSLYPNDATSSPSSAGCPTICTSYTVHYALTRGQAQPDETWLVPTGSTISLSSVRVSPVPSSSATLQLWQIAAGAGTVGECPVLNSLLVWVPSSSCGAGGGGSVFTGSTAVTSACGATPTFPLADISVKSPTRFEPCALTANVTSVTFTNKTAGAKFSIASLQDGTGGRTVAYGASASNTCTISATASKTTVQEFEVAADGITVVGVGCTSDDPLDAPVTGPASSTANDCPRFADISGKALSDAGVCILNGGPLGTPSSGNASNLTNLPITLTTIGTSGPSTYTQSTNTLNIPQYAVGGGTQVEYLEFPATNSGSAGSGSAGTNLITSSSGHPANDGSQSGGEGGMDLETARGSEDDLFIYNIYLPSTWTGAVDVILHMYSHSSAGGNAFLKVYTGCAADGTSVVSGPTFNAASTSAVTFPGSGGQQVTASFTGIDTTNCSASGTMAIKVGRDSTNGSDTLAADVHLISITVVRRHT
jgi:hypothetical protein